ncbi:B-box zinc finger protein 20-like isoform X2 [Aristolochia californica]|uniref:B-box zinc finger protein 20-like isoform X2 n=1 Tax=Aristolochia californica TaxID=171875 RepID=UPI0035D9D9A6
MKIQCDVCGKQEASLFCVADEAALCDACDLRVHRANKLAGKHRRFSLLQPSSCKEAPRCDVCQERRAFLFCQEDRAILCRDCDVPIHTANEHTRKHNRFLLTGVKLALSCSTSPDEASPAAVIIKEKKLSATVGIEAAAAVETVVSGDGKSLEGCTSSISEYLIETLPGWHVEDFLSSSPTDGLCKVVCESETALVSGNVPFGVPQVPQFCPYSAVDSGFLFRDSTKQVNNPKNSRRWSEDFLAVPQISPPSKRHRPLFR